MATSPGTARSRAHSRRGSASLNFTNMSLFPLTSVNVLDLDEHSFSLSADHHLSKSPGPKLRNGSYIQHTSAPTTPGILSPNLSSYFTPVSPSSSHNVQRSGSSTPRTARSRRNSNHTLTAMQQQHESYISDLPKSKSTTQLYGDSHSSNVWMHRTGAALSSETREFKGQSWLVSRASSTSLVEEGRWDGEGDWQTRARGRSRIVKSRTGSRSRGVSGDKGHAGEASENEEGELEEETDDEEYLYREKGYGLGMWVDRIIGWSLFSVDDEEEEEEYRKDPYGEGRKKKKHLPPPPSPPPQSSPAQSATSTVVIAPDSSPQTEEDESWGDPSWAFSIVTQVLF